MKFLLAENGMLSTMLDKRENTSLHIACMHGHCKDVVETLLNLFQAALDMKDRNG